MFHQKPPLKIKDASSPGNKVKTENEILFELFFREQSRIKFVLMVTRLW